MSPNASGGYPEFPYTSQRDNALDYLRREANSSDGWTTFDNKDGVTYEKKSMPGDSSAIPLVRGKGVVEGFTPLQFLALITYPGVRTTWDTRTEHVEVRKRFGRHLTQFYAVQRGMGWIVSPRDIVGCQDTIYNEDGSVERVQTSVEDPDVPPVSGRVRATLTVAGWVLKPHEKGTDVTYLVKINPNGSIPIRIINGTIVPEIPGAISRAADVLRRDGYPPYAAPSMESILRSEGFSYSSRLFELSIVGKAGEELDIHYDSKVFGSEPKVEVSGEGSERVSVSHSANTVRLSLGDLAGGKELDIKIR